MAIEPKILLIEPFYGGSHKQLMDLLAEEIRGTELVTMTAKKWHWRARTASLYLSQAIPKRDSYRVLFASSVLNLTELASLRPDLAKLKKVLYFHENQLVYPVKKQQDRDFQYGYNQILSCIVADVIVFNSKFNQDSFLDNIKTFLKLMPDYRPKNLKEIIEPKCRVIHFPLKLPSKVDVSANRECEIQQSDCCSKTEERLECDSSDLETRTSDQCSSPAVLNSDIGAKKISRTENILSGWCKGCDNMSGYSKHLQMDSDSVGHDSSCGGLVPEKECLASGAKCKHGEDTLTLKEESHKDVRPLHIVWPHRWEHDKGPEVLFDTLYKLEAERLDFKISILGETYLEVPAIFSEAKERLSSHILNWGFLESKEQYYNVLRSADVVVSTAKHEFFGVAMLESVHLGCYPLCPRRLVYPEIFPDDHLYNTDQQLFKRLRNFCRRPEDCRRARINMDVEKYSWQRLVSDYKDLFT